MQSPTQRRLEPSPPSGARFALALVAVSALLTGWIVAGDGPPVIAQDTSPQPPEGWELSGDAERVQATYDKFCGTCHGATGKGDGVMAKFLEPKPKDLTDREYMESRSDYEIYLAIKKGGAAVGLSDKMAPWEQLLGDQEIRDLTLLVRRMSRGE